LQDFLFRHNNLFKLFFADRRKAVSEAAVAAKIDKLANR